MAANSAQRFINWSLAIATGALTFLAFPGWNIHYLAWCCAVPLLIAARNATVYEGFRLGLLAGTVTNFGGFHWMTFLLKEFGHLPMPVASGILLLQAVTQGLTMAVGVAAWRWLARRGSPQGPAAWAGLWLGEAAIPMIFPWFLGNALSPELPMIQIADLGGVHLVSALAWAANAALFTLIAGALDRKVPGLIFPTVVAGCAALTFGYGTLRIGQIDAAQAAAPKAKIGMVEGNVGIWEKEARHLDGRARALTLRHNLLKHQRMSADLQAQGAELILWPESAYMPYGTLPLLHTDARFLLVGAGGAVLRDDGDQLRAEAPDRLGLPRDLGLLTGLSSPRGDLWRAIDQGRRVVTVGVGGATVRDLPEGELAVATASPPPDWFGKIPDGYVVARSGKVWQAGWPAEGKVAKAVARDAESALTELRSRLTAPVDLTAAACNSQGECAAVGRRGALVAFSEGVVRPIASPTDQDLWAIAGDPSGALLVAAGAGGTVLVADGGSWRSEVQGSKTWFAAWTCSGGSAWIGGENGQVSRRDESGKWRALPPVTSDILAGACDADGQAMVVGRGGKVWTWRGDRWFAPDGSSRGELTAIVGFSAHASLALSRGAKRIVPSAAPLPSARTYPDDVLADANTSEVDRSSPRRGFTTPLLFGALSHGKPLNSGRGQCEECFNSAVLLGARGEVEAIHDKAFLLAFGEYMPLGDRFPQLYDLSPETSHFQAGVRTAPIDLRLDANRTLRMGMLICYEDLLPSYARRVAVHNPNVLINLTNDAWFGQTAEPEHHLNLALMRTVEYRRWLLRSTNTGISAYIDAAGRRIAETKLTGEETLLREVPLLEERTVYASLGDWPLLVLGLVWGVLWLRTIGGGGAVAKGPKPSKPAKKKSAKA